MNHTSECRSFSASMAQAAPGIVSHNGAFYEEKLIHLYRIRKEQKKVIRQECRARAASDEHACEAPIELNLNYLVIARAALRKEIA